jgi:lysophospholipase L1-like esterase
MNEVRVGRRLPLVAVGDSISQRGHSPDGFLTLLSNYFARRVDVINRGYSGYNTPWLRALIEQQSRTTANKDVRRVWTYGEEEEVEEEQQRKDDGQTPATTSSSSPSAVYLLCIGANDAVFPPSTVNKQFVSVDDYSEHVTGIVHRLRGPPPSSRVALILITPPSTDPHAWAEFQAAKNAAPSAVASDVTATSSTTSSSSIPSSLPPLIRSSVNTARYAHAMKEVGAALNVPVIDLFTLTSASEQANPFLCDGLHLNSRGNLVLFTAILQTLAQHWPQLSISRMPIDSPFHGDITVDNWQEWFA